MSNISYVETNPKDIIESLIKSYEDLTGETLYPGDEKRLFLYNLAQIVVSIKNGQNEGLKSNLLRYAVDEKLDALGEFTDTIRLSPTYSKSKVKFILSSIQTFDVVVAKDTLLTPDGKFFFKTEKDLIIKAAENFGIVPIIAVEPGEEYNGFLSGQIKNLVKPINHISEAVNIEPSSGGSNKEDNDRYRDRIRLAPRGFSVAGPEGAYEYHAKSVNSDIEDVKIFSPSPGVVRLIILMVNGEIPSQQVLDSVLEMVSAKDKRPLTDKVEVVAPTLVEYDINFTYYILKEKLLYENTIKEDVNKAVDEYKLWQKSNLGRSINPDYLRKLVLNAGANRIVVTSPTFTTLDVDRIAVATNITVTYGGLD